MGQWVNAVIESFIFGDSTHIYPACLSIILIIIIIISILLLFLLIIVIMIRRMVTEQPGSCVSGRRSRSPVRLACGEGVGGEGSGER